MFLKNFLLFSILLLGLLTEVLAQEDFSKTAIHHVNYLDVEKGTIEYEQTIIINNGIIDSIIHSDQFTRSDSIKVIDLEGYFVIPGLIDAHVHLGTDPSSYDNLERTTERLEYLLSQGVTGVRDMAGDARYLSYLSRQASLDEISSPDIYYSALMAGESFFSDPRTRAAAQGLVPGSAPWMRAINSETDIDIVMAQAKGTGATGIKVYADLDHQNIARIVEAAHQQNMIVWAHSCVFPARPSEVCESGVDVMSHATYLAWESQSDIPESAKNRHRKHDHFDINDPSYTKLIELMANKGTVLDATIGVYKRYFPDSTLYQYAVSLTKLAHANKVKIGVGTDMPIIDTMAIAPIIMEMKALQEDVTMSPAEVIKSATLINAQIIGEADKIGSIDIGKKANLLIIKQNPTESVDHLINPHMVIKNGMIINETKSF